MERSGWPVAKPFPAPFAELFLISGFFLVVGAFFELSGISFQVSAVKIQRLPSTLNLFININFHSCFNSIAIGLIADT